MNWLALTLTALTLAVVAHAVLVRMYPRANPVIAFLICGTPMGLALAVVLASGSRLNLVAGLAVYAFLCELYLFAFTFVISSLAVSILLGLRSPGPAAGRAVATNAELTPRRLSALERNGFLRAEAGRRTLTAKGRVSVSFYRGLRAFFRHDAA